MAKLKTSFFCQNCGQNYAKWVGQCSACKQWNTVVEEVLEAPEKKAWKSGGSGLKKTNKPLKIGEISTETEVRLDTLNQEFNRVLGGGLGPWVIGASRRRTWHWKKHPIIANCTEFAL